MKLRMVVADDWTARIAAALAAGGARVSAVVLTDDAARRSWQRHRPPLQVAVNGEDVDYDATVSFGTWGAAWGEFDPADPRPRFAWDATCDGLHVSDPAAWCARTGSGIIELRLIRSSQDHNDLRVVATATVNLTEASYAANVAIVADSLADLLGPAALTADAGPAVEPLRHGPLRLDAAMSRVEWTAPATDVVRLVRSAADQQVLAWTYLNGYPVSIAAAEVLKFADCNVAPGTIVGHRGTVTVVQAGRGVVGLSGLRDLIGEITSAALEPGLRLGLDPQDELRNLTRRVADLERTLHWHVTSAAATRDESAAR